MINEAFVTEKNLKDPYEVREEVFIKEQEISEKIEKDEYDKEAIHVIIYKDNNPIATGRLLEIDGEYSIGRVAVKKEFRGQNFGKRVMSNLIKKGFEIGAYEIEVHAQKSVQGFYDKLGFKAYGDDFFEAGIKHVMMKISKDNWNNPYELLKIQIDKVGVFISRPNRFLAKVSIDGKEELAHVHDPGRLEELLYSGNRVQLRKAKNKNRKTAWDVIAADSEDGWILINSSFHRWISEGILKNKIINPIGKVTNIKAEVKYQKSRIDFVMEDKKGKEVWLETKGCSLSEDGVAKFPDAPTKRGTRHLEELIELKESGKRAVVYFLVLRKSNYFTPKEDTDPKFSKTFYKALESGVEIYPIQLNYKDGIIYYDSVINIK